MTSAKMEEDGREMKEMAAENLRKMNANEAIQKIYKEWNEEWEMLDDQLVEDMQHPKRTDDDPIFMPLLINGVKFECLIDMGSSVNLIPMMDVIVNNFRPDLSPKRRPQPRIEPGRKVRGRIMAIVRPESEDWGEELEFLIMDDIRQPVIGAPSLKGSILEAMRKEEEREQKPPEDEDDWRQFLLDVRDGIGKDDSKKVQRNEESPDLRCYEKISYDELELEQKRKAEESAWEKHRLEETESRQRGHEDRRKRQRQDVPQWKAAMLMMFMMLLFPGGFCTMFAPKAMEASLAEWEGIGPLEEDALSDTVSTWDMSEYCPEQIGIINRDEWEEWGRINPDTQPPGYVAEWDPPEEEHGGMNHDPEEDEWDHDLDRWYANYHWVRGERLWIVKGLLKDAAMMPLMALMGGFRRIRRTIRRRRREAGLVSLILMMTLLKSATAEFDLSKVNEDTPTTKTRGACQIVAVKEEFWGLVARFQKEVVDDLYMLDLSFKWRLTKLDWTADGRLDQNGRDDMGYWYEWAKSVQKELHPLEEGSEWTKGKRDGRIALFETEEVEKRERKRFLEIMRKMRNLNFKVAQLIEVTGK